MKFVAVFAALFAVVLAAPQPTNPADAQATILHEESNIDPVGNFKYALKTSNGIESDAEGHVKPNLAKSLPGDPEQIVAIRGSFSFVAEDGQKFTVNYVADENGYQPEGAHLPVAPVS